MSCKLYSCWISSCSWRVRICLALKQVEYEYIAVPILSLSDKDDLKDDDEHINDAMYQVPTFVDNEVHLSQSMAIIDYIEGRYKGYPLLPSNLVLRARITEVYQLICSGIQPMQNNCVLKKVGATKMEWARYWIAAGFDNLEKILAKYSGKYCVGDEITMADACLVPQVYNAIVKFGVDMSKYPVISRINKSLLEHPAFQISHPENQPDCSVVSNEEQQKKESK